MLVLALLVLVNTQAQEIIENPERQRNSNAGRVRKVEEILRITDESGEFYFKYPYLIKVAFDDSLFMKDTNQLLRFDKKGQFLRNYFVKGQGPGEFNSVNNYYLIKDRLIIYDGTTKRITWLNFDGDLIKDFKIDLEVRLPDFLFFNNNTYYFLSRDHIITDEKPQIVDWPHRLLAVTQKGKAINELKVFPVKMYMLSSQYRAIWRPISQFVITLFNEEYLLVSHTQEYLINIFDFETQNVIRNFKRTYKRVKTPSETKERIGTLRTERKEYPVPGIEFLCDVQNIFLFNDKIWIQTSTRVDNKGDLIDVFNIEGEFIDSFYIDINGTLVATHKDCIFVREKDKDELLSVVKYKILD